MQVPAPKQTPGAVRHPWTRRTPADADLCSKVGISPFALYQVRRALWGAYEALSRKEQQDLSLSGTPARMAFMVRELRRFPTVWAAWKQYTEHSDRDFDEMCRCEYPIGPYLIRAHTDLFGVTYDFLLLGAAPRLNHSGLQRGTGQRVGSR